MADPGIEVSASTFRSIVYAKKEMWSYCACNRLIFYCVECFPNNLAEVKLSWDSLPELRYPFCWEKLVVTTRHKVLYGWIFLRKTYTIFSANSSLYFCNRKFKKDSKVRKLQLLQMCLNSGKYPAEEALECSDSGFYFMVTSSKII